MFRLKDLYRNLFANPSPTRRMLLRCESMEDRVNPTPVLTVSGTASVVEGGAALITITRDDATDYLEGGFSLTGTATIGDDYPYPESFRMAFEPGANTFEHWIMPAEDFTGESPETVILSISSGDDYTVGSSSSATVTIYDAPVVSVTKLSDAVEGGSPGQVEVRRVGGIMNEPLTINISTDNGTATSGTDFDDPGTNIEFPANEDTVLVDVTALHDTEWDPFETAGIQIETPDAEGDIYSIALESWENVNIGEDANGHFEDENGLVGTIWYDVPLSLVDPDLATQSVSLSDFTLEFGGEIFTEANATFEIAPTGDLEYGTLVNMQFEILFDPPVNGYESLEPDAGVATAIDAVTQEPVTAAVADNGQATLVLDFSPITVTEYTETWVITVTYEDNTVVNVGNVSLPGSGNPLGTPSGWRNIVRDAMKAKGIDAKEDPDSNTRLIIKAPEGEQLKKVEIRTNNVDLPPGPKLHYREKRGAQADPEYSYFANE